MIAAALCLFISDQGFERRKEDDHNCRFWGIVLTEMNPILESVVQTHLDSLQGLGQDNPDGWGIGYYVAPDSGIIPVVTKGEPVAPFDPRYDKAVDDMIKYMKKAGIAHVRKTTTGLLTGIPDPHPFARKTINRDFNMLFAHNGHLSTSLLSYLIMATDPSYADSNPPDYAPNFIDSDLLFIYLLEYIDSYTIFPIETCIRMAITKLDSASGAEPIVVNFVMMNDSALWALRFAQTAADAYPVHYYPNGFMSDFWIAASVPLDTFSSFWIALPNSTLVTLIPNQPPKFTSIYPEGHVTEDITSLHMKPNPFSSNTEIHYYVSTESEISLNIYNTAGSLTKNLVAGRKEHGWHSLTWSGTDDRGNYLANGSYFCQYIAADSCLNEKIVLIK